ncbi:MAG TPA: urea ABC transporter ATP-binding subunit UrtE [Chloroflexota bacterium]
MIDRAATLTIRDLAAGYGESRVVHDLALDVAPGQVACVMGRNGVGKTTLVRTIVGLLPVQAGRIELDGRDVTRAEPHLRARVGIGYVPQGRGIFPHLTVGENLLMGFEAVGRVDPRALGEAIELFPVLGQMSDRAAGVLSGGQQQQLAIARALVQRPRLLVLDEPTEGIQPSIVGEIEAVVQALRAERGTTILLVEQFLDFAVAVADRYYVMEGGTIVAHGVGVELADDTVRRHLAV